MSDTAKIAKLELLEILRISDIAIKEHRILTTKWQRDDDLPFKYLEVPKIGTLIDNRIPRDIIYWMPFDTDEYYLEHVFEVNEWMHHNTNFISLLRGEYDHLLKNHSEKSDIHLQMDMILEGIDRAELIASLEKYHHNRHMGDSEESDPDEPDWDILDELDTLTVTRDVNINFHHLVTQHELNQLLPPDTKIQYYSPRGILATASNCNSLLVDLFNAFKSFDPTDFRKTNDFHSDVVVFQVNDSKQSLFALLTADERHTEASEIYPGQNTPSLPTIVAHETWLHYNNSKIGTFGLGKIVELHPKSTYSEDR